MTARSTHSGVPGRGTDRDGPTALDRHRAPGSAAPVTRAEPSADAVRFVRRPLDALAPRELFELLRLRIDVFVVEQACAYPELDERDADPTTRHVLGYLDGRLVACARTMLPGGSGDLVGPGGPGGTAEPARIGRVAVRASYRGTGLARTLMEWTLAALERERPEADVTLGAQVTVERFYASLGFERVSEEYLEDGIPHVDMARRHGETSGR